MGRSRALLLGIAVACFASSAGMACNAIVGVEDVKYKSQSSGQEAGSGDDDDTNTDPDPVTPTPKGDSGSNTGDSSTIPPACNGAVGCERLVFVTHDTFDGNLGGTDGADAKCTAAANKIPGYAGRQFKAWLSDLAKDVSSRVAHGSKPYRRIDRSLFANDYADLTDGTVSQPLYLDETGAALTGTALERSVWTATDGAGVWNVQDCNSWVTNATTTTGAYGDSQMADVNWTQVPGPATSACDAKKHLYCFEL